MGLRFGFLRTVKPEELERHQGVETRAIDGPRGTKGGGRHDGGRTGFPADVRERTA